MMGLATKYLTNNSIIMVMSRGRRGRRTKSMVNIAGERIDILFRLAEEEALNHNLDRANGYVDLARKIGMRYNVRVPGQFKRRYCRFCHSYLIPSQNARFRVRGKRIIVSCNNCGGVMRMPYFKDAKGKSR